MDVPRLFVPGFPENFYPELVLEYQTFYRNLPESIEAVFYMAGSEDCVDDQAQPWMGTPTRTKCEGYARWVHQKLVETWPANVPPLLVLDAWNRAAPFSEAP